MPNYELLYAKDVVRRDIPRLSSDVKIHIQQTVQSKLSSFPNQFGVPLRKDLKGYWKLRIGDYRVIYKISGKIVEIFRIGHRKEIYKRSL